MLASLSRVPIPKTLRPKTLKIDVFDYPRLPVPTVVWRLVSKEPREYPHKPYIAIELLDYIFAADTMVLSSFTSSRWAPKMHVFWKSAK